MYVIAGKFVKVRRQCLFLLLVINLCIIFITITLWKIYKPIIANFFVHDSHIGHIFRTS